MSSFFEKLKKGMNVEIPPEEPEEQKELIEDKKKKGKNIAAKKKVSAKNEKKQIKTQPPREEEKKELKTEKRPQPTPMKEKQKIEIEELPQAEITEEKSDFDKILDNEERWIEAEGQLAIDCYQTKEEIVIQAAIAGIKPDELDVTIEKDVITIRGLRERTAGDEERNYFYQECYWGQFSREIIMPEETDPSRATAEMKEGILTIRIPKIGKEKKRKINIKG